MMRVKRYHIPAMNLVERARGATSQPIHMTAAQAHHSEWLMYRLWVISSASASHGSSFTHSMGVNLDTTNRVMETRT